MPKFDITIRIETEESLSFNSAIEVIEKCLEDENKEKEILMIEYVED